MIKGLHHNAYRCRDSEETRAFYEDFLGLPLVNALDLSETKTGRPSRTLHTFYRLDDGSCLAFFETEDFPFEFKRQHDFDLHIALEVGADVLQPMLTKGRIDLLPRPERLRHRTVRQASRARYLDGPGQQRRA
jgi:catechol 2,3-dioxygenase-like lactoylglutathione lyase family enzyme